MYCTMFYDVESHRKGFPHRSCIVVFGPDPHVTKSQVAIAARYLTMAATEVVAGGTGLWQT
jgi:hypothetical protein